MIIEAALLNDEEKITACTLSKAAGADFVKTSTGFGPGGATAADVALMRRVVGAEMGVKAAGGVRDLEGLKAMVAAGATRVGASAGVKIVQESKGQKPAGTRAAAGRLRDSDRPTRPLIAAVRLSSSSRTVTTRSGKGISIPSCSNRRRIRLRNSRPTSHCFSGTVLMRILRIDRPVAERVHAQDFERLEDPRREGRIGLHLGADLAQHARRRGRDPRGRRCRDR